MGGFGSGGWYHFDKKTTIEETKRVDIRVLKKWGWLDRPHSGTISWSIGGENCGTVSARTSEDELTLNYRYRTHGNGDWQDVKQTIHFDLTPCHYGGVRKWFSCPYCDLRVAVLSGAGKYFACRKCYKLAYASQSECKIERLISAKHKLGERIFENYDGEGYWKKKGMHQRNFDRLQARYWELNEETDRAINVRFSKYATF